MMRTQAGLVFGPNVVSSSLAADRPARQEFNQPKHFTFQRLIASREKSIIYVCLLSARFLTGGDAPKTLSTQDAHHLILTYFRFRFFETILQKFKCKMNGEAVIVGMNFQTALNSVRQHNMERTAFTGIASIR